MTEKVITITYTFDKHGNPKGLGLILDGDNVFVKDDNYLRKFIADVTRDSIINNGYPELKLVKK